MSWEQRNADFSKGMADAQMAYIEAEREVDRLQTENAKLREQIHWLKQGDILHVLTDQEYIDQCEREHLMQVSIDALDKENAKLRELVRGLQYCANEAYGMCARVPVGGSRPFTCCPLYDFDAKVYGCEKLRLELGIKVDE